LSRDNDEFDSFGSGIESLFSDIFDTFGGSLFDVTSSSLMPLFNLDVSGSMVTATFDLPGVRPEDVAITCTEDSISVDAEMARPVRMRVSSRNPEQKEFVRYSRKIVLPVKVDPEKGNARFRNGLLLVRLPRRSEGRPVKIGTGPAMRRLTSKNRQSG